MTGLETIIDQIRQDAEEAARHQTEQAQAAAKEILDQGRALGEKQAADIKQAGQAKKADLLERAKSAAQLETRKTLLAAKQRLIAQAVQASKQRLKGLEAGEYFAVLQKLAKKYSRPEPGEMRLSQTDLARLPQDFAAGLPGGISVSRTAAAIENGFLLIYGGIDVNCSFDALFADAAEDLQDLTAGILFG